MNIKKILCGVLAGLLLCTGVPGNVTEAQGKSTASNLFSNGTETKPELNSQPVVTFRYSNGKIYKRYTVSNGKLKLPSMANKKGCTFMGWSKVKGRTANPAYESGDTITVKSNMNLYAVEFRRSAEPNLSGKSIQMPRKYSRVIFVGDSRTYAMGKVVSEKFGKNAFPDVYFVAKTGSTLDWLESTGESNLMNILASGNGKTAVIFNHGVNDLNHNWSNVNVKSLANTYTSYMKKLGRTLQKKNCDLYYMSVNPLNSGTSARLGRHDPQEIRQFNQLLCGQLGGMYQFIDTYSYLRKNGYGTARWLDRQNEDDGLHYTYKTYKRIFSYCMKSINSLKVSGDYVSKKF